MLQTQDTQFKFNCPIYDKPEIYVACLSAYNEGHLHGKWIECHECYENVVAEINDMLKNSPVQNAEEWAIHDYNGFYQYKVSESENIEKLCEIASTIYQADKEEQDKGFVVSYLINEYGIDRVQEQLEDYFYGCFSNDQDFIYDYAENMGILEGASETAKMYFDYDFYLRDVLINEIYTIETPSDTYYFRNN